jgi:excinuclease ABC subunit C
VGLISEKDYRELVDGAIMFLEGRNLQLIKRLKQKMIEASSQKNYEKAAKIRDQIASIEATLEEQKVVSPLLKDQDVFAAAKEDKSIVIEALFVREGRLTGARDFAFHNVQFPDGEIFSSFLTQFYRGERYIPDEVLISIPLEDVSVIGDWLSEKKGKKVAIQSPRRGHKKKLISMAEANAKEALKKKAAPGRENVVGQLQTRLRLKDPPRVIEAFDISNIGGKQAVGAMVTFSYGRPDKSRYRLYRIKTVEEPDDYAMMYEVLLRRYGKPGAPPTPDLIVVDGGKGQLNIALRVMEELKIKGTPIAALAKERAEGAGRAALKGERIYLPGVKDPIWLKEGTGADLLLRRIRDEVHRFAIKYHRRLRAKEIASALDRIPGIGDKRKSMLFNRFGDLKGIAGADIEELSKIPGITIKLARAIKDGLRTAG